MSIIIPTLIVVLLASTLLQPLIVMAGLDESVKIDSKVEFLLLGVTNKTRASEYLKPRFILPALLMYKVRNWSFLAIIVLSIIDYLF